MDALLWMGTANAVLAGVLAVLAALSGWLFCKRPALVHGLWLLVLLKLVTPPLVPLHLAVLPGDPPSAPVPDTTPPPEMFTVVQSAVQEPEVANAGPAAFVTIDGRLVRAED